MQLGFTCFQVGLQLPPEQGVERRSLPRLRALLQALLRAAELPELVQALVAVPLWFARLLPPPQLPALRTPGSRSLPPAGNGRRGDDRIE